MAEVFARKLGLRARISNILAALRGVESFQGHDAFTVSVNLDTSQFDADFDRIKSRVAEIAELASAAVLPSPRLLFMADRPLSSDQTAALYRAVEMANETGKPLLIDAGIQVFQQIGDRWQSLDGPKTWLGVDPAEPGGDYSVEIRSGTISFGGDSLKQAREAIGSGLATEQYTDELVAFKASEDRETSAHDPSRG